MATDDRTIGLLKRDDIVQQLAHVAAIQGKTADELQEMGISEWHWMAASALGLDRQFRELEASVIATVRRREEQS